MPAPLLIAAALEIARLAAPRLVRHLTDSDKAADTAERVIEAAQTVTGTTAPAEAMAKLKADPNLVLQLNVRLQEIEADRDAAILADRQDARRRDVELAKLGARNKRADLMVTVDAIGLVVCVVVLALYRNDIPEGVVTLLTTIASIFGLCLRDAHQFEFGSSRSSQMKDETIAQSISRR